MKIVCPSCQAQYAVPEIVLTARRKMRCARCGTEWVPADVVAPVAAEPVAAALDGDAPFVDALGLGAEEKVAQPDVAEEPVLALAVPVYELVDDPLPQDPEPVLPVPERPVALRQVTPVSLSPGPAKTPHDVVVPPARPGVPVLAWGGSIAVLVVVLAAAVIFRGPVMRAWPPSARLYAGLGLADR
jgi:predicted Zn finger-like uncharacterized protein